MYAVRENGYRFGFNGKEKDDEVKGVGNSLDFGARIYDSRLGRWLSVDPLHKKYPNLSPYVFCANNPIIYIDKDGRDYELIVNSKDKTIIIKATYYTVTTNETKRIGEAINEIMSESGKYSLKTKDGEVYKIVYDLQVIEKGGEEYFEKPDGSKVRIDEGRNAIESAYLDPSGNSFTESNDPAKIGDYGEALNGKNILVVEENISGDESKKVDKHEPSHTLGVSHKAIGRNGANYNKKVIGAILEYAGFNIKRVKEKHTLSSNVQRPNVKVTGNENENFGGKVIKTK